MAAVFETSYVTNVGATEATLYPAPAGLTGKHLIISFVVTNTLGSAIPITAKLVRGSDTIYIAYNKRVLPNCLMSSADRNDSPSNSVNFINANV